MTTQLRELPPVTCPKYDPLPGTKRCRHYLPNGACALADEFMCVEWMKVNGPAQAPVATPSPAPFTLDLFGAPMVHAPPGALPPAAPAPPASSAPAVVGALSQLDVASFKARGLEVLLATSQLGDVWLVPAYTGADRQELSVDHALLIATLAAAIPGANVAAIVRTPKGPVPS